MSLSSVKRVFESLSFHGNTNPAFVDTGQEELGVFSLGCPSVSRSQLGWCMCLWRKEKMSLFSTHFGMIIFLPKRDTCFLSHAE